MKKLLLIFTIATLFVACKKEDCKPMEVEKLVYSNN